MKKFSTLLKIVLIVFCLFLNIWNLRADEVNGKIAVIPFENLMGDASINWLSAGMALFIHFKT